MIYQLKNKTFESIFFTYPVLFQTIKVHMYIIIRIHDEHFLLYFYPLFHFNASIFLSRKNYHKQYFLTIFFYHWFTIFLHLYDFTLNTPEKKTESTTCVSNDFHFNIHFVITTSMQNESSFCLFVFFIIYLSGDDYL